MKPICVLLADDHTLVRAGFRALLQSLADIQVVAEASEGHEALRLIAQHQPDVVLMDIGMPGLNGLEATAQITQKFPSIRVIILSMHATEEYVLRALQSGAVGYLLKDAGTSELELAVRAVIRGETYLSPAVSKHVIAEYTQRVSSQPPSLEPLTPRQRGILQLIAKGYTTKEIAQMLHLSVKTVETHRLQLMTRLDIHDIAGLVRYAIRVGLIAPDE
jgi:DNA-binding NarL/FixJ family response regulator